MAGATVTFLPATVDAASGFGAQAQTADDGSFTVESSFDRGKTTQSGLPAGEYKVTVAKMEAAAGGVSLDRPPKNSLPAKFAMVESTPLSATIKADGDNQLEFPL